MPRRRTPAVSLSAVVIAMVVVACGSPAPSGGPAGTAAAGATATTAAGATTGPAASAATPASSVEPEGSATPSAAPAGTDVTGVVGVDWYQVPLPDSLAAEAFLSSVAATADGHLVATGEPRYGYPLAWTSADGTTWTTTPLATGADRYPYVGGVSGQFAPSWRRESNVKSAATTAGLVVTDRDREVWTGDGLAPVSHATSGLADPIKGFGPASAVDVDGSADTLLMVVPAWSDAAWRAANLVYASRDGGATWSGVVLPPRPGKTASTTPSVVAVDGRSALVAGTGHHIGPDDRYGYPTYPADPMAVWRSADGGATWRVVTSTAFPKDALPMDADIAGAVAVIAGAVGNTATRTGVRPVAWIDAGSGWTQTSLPRGGHDAGAATAALVEPDGTVVLAGWRGDIGATATATVWRLAADRTWTAVDLPGEAGSSARVESIAQVPGGLVAVGTDGSRAAIWVSGTFHLPPASASDPTAGLADVTVSSISALPGGRFVALGRDLGSGRMATWSSADGVTWTRTPDATMPPAASETSLAGAPSSPFTVGEALLHVDGGRLVALVGGVTRTSTDGVTWTEVAGSGNDRVAHPCGGTRDRWAAGQELDFTVTGDTIVAVGTGQQCHAYSTGDSSGASYRSTDGGRTWQFSPYSDTLRGKRGWFTQMTRVVGIDGGYLAAGTSIEKSITWRSSDGLHWTPTVLGPREAFSPSAMVIGDAGTVLMLGTGGDGASPMVRQSTDGGRTWSAAKVIDPAATPDTAVSITAVEWTGSRWAAAGTVKSGYTSLPVAYTSPDGATWTRQDLATDGPSVASDYRVVGVATSGGVTVVAGEWMRQARFWVLGGG